MGDDGDIRKTKNDFRPIEIKIKEDKFVKLIFSNMKTNEKFKDFQVELFCKLFEFLNKVNLLKRKEILFYEEKKIEDIKIMKTKIDELNFKVKQITIKRDLLITKIENNKKGANSFTTELNSQTEILHDLNEILHDLNVKLSKLREEYDAAVVNKNCINFLKIIIKNNEIIKWGLPSIYFERSMENFFKNVFLIFNPNIRRSNQGRAELKQFILSGYNIIYLYGIIFNLSATPEIEGNQDTFYTMMIEQGDQLGDNRFIIDYFNNIHKLLFNNNNIPYNNYLWLSLSDVYTDSCLRHCKGKQEICTYLCSFNSEYTQSTYRPKSYDDKEIYRVSSLNQDTIKREFFKDGLFTYSAGLYKRPNPGSLFYEKMKNCEKQMISGPSSSVISAYKFIFNITKILPKTEDNIKRLILSLIYDYYDIHHSIPEILLTIVPYVNRDLYRERIEAYKKMLVSTEDETSTYNETIDIWMKKHNDIYDNFKNEFFEIVPETELVREELLEHTVQNEFQSRMSENSTIQLKNITPSKHFYLLQGYVSKPDIPNSIPSLVSSTPNLRGYKLDINIEKWLIKYRIKSISFGHFPHKTNKPKRLWNISQKIVFISNDTSKQFRPVLPNSMFSPLTISYINKSGPENPSLNVEFGYLSSNGTVSKITLESIGETEESETEESETEESETEGSETEGGRKNKKTRRKLIHRKRSRKKLLTKKRFSKKKRFYSRKGRV